jgi:hypothetical protein
MTDRRFDDADLQNTPIRPHDPAHVATVTALCKKRGAEDVLEYLFGEVGA